MDRPSPRQACPSHRFFALLHFPPLVKRGIVEKKETMSSTAEASSLSRQQSLKWLQLKADTILRLSIIHEATGVPLVDHIWRWRGHQNSTHYSDLVQTALKVGGSIRDSGGLRYVLFEPLEGSAGVLKSSPVPPMSRDSPVMSSYSSSPTMTPRRKKALKWAPFKSTANTTRLVFLAQSGFIISAFHGAAASWERVDELIHGLVASFAASYTAKVAFILPELQTFERAKSKGHPVDVIPIQSHFKDFIPNIQSAVKSLHLA